LPWNIHHPRTDLSLGHKAYRLRQFVVKHSCCWSRALEEVVEEELHLTSLVEEVVVVVDSVVVVVEA